jgi:exonuclease SbcC
MRVERVTAHAFGPFRGESLDLAPGMTVVAGPNEAGKTSWHAALRVALCGVRRARGRATAADAAFEQRHRPWDATDAWQVEARLLLDDGRTVEIAQDLAGKVACRATDIGLGRDISDEIMDGTPDAARWLGLDRDSFAATVSVSQAQIMAIADGETAAALQEHMQRAAATRGTDGTVAEARERLAAFRREHVGLDRQGSRAPLRTSLARVASAQEALAEARRHHIDYLDSATAADSSERAALATATRVNVIEAALARRQADAAGRRAARAAELATRHPTPPARAADRDERADAVAQALDAWVRRPRVEALSGPPSTEIQRELEALPAEPRGDVAVHPSVADARRRLDLARTALELHGARPDALPDTGPSEAVLRDLARRVATPEPPPDPLLEAELAAARGALGRGGNVATWLAGVGAVAAIAALAMAALGQPLAAIALVAVAMLVVALAWLRWSGGGRGGTERIRSAEAAIAPHRAARDHARRERAAAEVEAAELGLPADPGGLETRADERGAADRARRAVADWDRDHAALTAGLDDATAALRAALAARGVDAGTDPLTGFAAYEAACREAAARAMRAGRGEALRQALGARLAAERAQESARRTVAAAETALREAARSIGALAEAEPDAIVASLRAWQADRAVERDAAEEALAGWQELVALLDGRSLDEVRTDATARASRASELEATLGTPAPATLVARDDLEPLLGVERDELERARRTADAQAGALEQMRRDLPDVAEAEEALALATAEHERVVALGRVIDETHRLLRVAEEQVHRDLAPILAGSVRRWLPSVSGARYADVSVDPADLSVRVKEAATGQWRSALLLSEGTREQIYLLLRVAMAQHLVTTGETAPLLLDEVTAQADPDRTARLLEVLHRISQDRQVIMFSHDPAVAAWAERTFDGERDRLVRLPAPIGHQPAAFAVAATRELVG